MSACPHNNVADCPLYVISHDARFTGVSCTTAAPNGFACRIEAGRQKYPIALQRATRRAFAIARRNLLAPGDNNQEAA
ncbi:hypothetical protein JN531_012565 [Flagellatimonas centrodinii]|uniref:hypothetical protein n=1 Tax=Flagellatimonas centrodinii TaxID=2806210 RepID=UPI001FEE2C3B|nr:hypothetical protein [Flagellatimonas centrodinii]ULQ45932.1 hypothetical protein JN531_012565 [Flagellatimonas centrodinii]